MNRAAEVFLIIFFAPIWVVLLLIVSLLLLVSQGCPIIFKDVRAGLKGKEFTLYKFRTMRPGQEDDNKRITKVGSFLRKTSLDELPELINVLKGDMSLVGPRPLPVRYLSRYTRREFSRHDVKPGITGLAQVNGRNLLSWEEKFEFDLEYVSKKSFLFDVRILVKTVMVVFLARGINERSDTTMSEFRAPSQESN